MSSMSIPNFGGSTHARTNSSGMPVGMPNYFQAGPTGKGKKWYQS